MLQVGLGFIQDGVCACLAEHHAGTICEESKDGAISMP